MPPNRRYLIAAGIALAAILVFPAIVYWSRVWAITGFSPYRCIYGDAACSLTVATYGLCAVTASAFLAACYAGFIALKTLRLEQSRILVERPVSGGNIPVDAHVVECMFEGTEPRLGKPQAAELATFESQLFRFDSIGRAPIVDVQLVLTFSVEGRSSEPPSLAVDIGSLASGGFAYVRLYVQKTGTRLRGIRWGKVEPKTRGLEPIDFHSHLPARELVVQSVRAFPPGPAPAASHPAPARGGAPKTGVEIARSPQGDVTATWHQTGASRITISVVSDEGRAP